MWMASLGGFMNCKGDGFPGPQVLWRGWRRLQDITDLFEILSSGLCLFGPGLRNQTRRSLSIHASPRLPRESELLTQSLAVSYCPSALVPVRAAFARVACVEASTERSFYAMEEGMRSVIPPFVCLLLLGSSLPGHAQDAAEYEVMLEESSNQHMREELGINPITVPSIRELLQTLDSYRPVPVELIEQNNRDATFPNRMQTCMHFGSLIADGFMLTLAERSRDIEEIGKSLLRQAHNLGVGDRLTSRSKSLLEKSSQGDWIGMREELIRTQGDVEVSMMELRDEEMVHMISFGGWLRGFQLATTATTQNYFPTRAAGLANVEIMDYFLDRLDTLHPRLKKTELVTSLVSKMQTLRALAERSEGRSPTREEVAEYKKLADELFVTAMSQVDDEGRIVGPPR